MEHFFKIISKVTKESVYDSKTPYHNEEIALRAGDELRKELNLSYVNYEIIAEPAMQEA